MAEFNPYKLEEEKWTPKNVYEILPPNAVSWSDYDFGQGTDNVDQEAAKKSLIDGFVDFFKELLGTAGQILGGAIELGVGIFTAFAEGISNFVGEIADAIGGVFTHDGARSKPIYDAIIAQMGPVKTQVNTLGQHLQELSTEVTERIDSQEVILEETQGHINDMSTILDEQSATLAQNQEDLDAARQETSAAIEQSGKAVSLAKSYNEALTKRITTKFNKAMGEAGKAITQAEANNAELVTMNTQLGEITQQASDLNTKLGEHNKKFTDGLADANSAIDEAVSVTAAVKKLAEKNQAKVSDAVSKAEKANADLALMSPKVADAVAKSDAATDNVATLTPKVSDAVTQAGAAVDKADAVTSAYNTFKTQQKARIDTAVSKAAKASQDVAALTPKVSDAVSKAGKASSDVSALTPKVTSASEDAAKASQDVAALSPKVTDAVSKSDKAVADVAALNPKVTAASNKATQAASDVADLTPKVTAAQDKADKAASDLSTLTPKVTAAQSRADAAYTEAGKVRSEVAPQIEAAQTKGESALAVADKAIDWLKNPVEIGSSLIALDVETKEPHYLQWAGKPATPSIAGLPFTKAVRVDSSTETRHNAPGDMQVPVKVNPDIVYKWSVWVYSNKPGTEIAFLTTSDSIGLCVEETTYRQDDRVYTSKWGIFPKDIPQWWSKHEGTIKFLPGTDNVHLYAVEWNKTDVADASQWIAALDIVPDVPTQASVDQAQNDAIKANQDILRQQEEINEAQRVANLAQDNFNDSQTKWNTTSENAIKALADADQAQKDINAEQKKFNNFQTEFAKDQTKWNKASSNATQALQDAAKAQEDVNAEQKKFNTFQTQFNKDQIEWNDAVARSIATQDTVNGNFQKWTEGATKAVEANTTAIKALNAPQTGSSILPMVPGTNTPTWLEPLRALDRGAQTADSVLPETVSEYYRWKGGVIPGGSAETVYIPHENVVTVDPNLEYEASWYVRSSTGSPRYAYVTFDSPETGNHCVEKTDDAEASSNTWGTPVRPLITPATATWTKQTSRFKFKPGTRSVRLTNIQFNNSGNSVDAYMYIADLQVAPKVPNQAQVDAAQNKAIEAFDLYMENQEDWNEGTTAALATQATVDENFKKWSDGAAEAITANTNAIKALNAPQTGSSVIPLMPGTTTPAWTANADKTGTSSSLVTGREDPTWYRFDGNRGTGSANMVAVDSSLEYDFSVWIHGTTNSVLYVAIVDQDGKAAIKSGAISSYTQNNGSKYLIENMSILSGWRKISTTLTLNPGVKFVRTGTIYANHSNGVEGSAYLSDMRMAPHIPTQAQVDDAQNKAIQANKDLLVEQERINQEQTKLNKLNTAFETEQKKINDKQTGINALNTKADSSLLQGLKALGKKSLGTSLVPYKTPSDQEVKDYNAGKLSYDPWADPEYFAAGPKITGSSKGRTPEATANDGTVAFEGSPVTVDSSIWHKVKFKTWASNPGSCLVIYMVNQNGDLALAETPFADSGRTSGGLVDYLTLPNGWKEWEGVVKFSQETTSVRLGTFYWNHPKGATTARQFFMDLEIVPDVPTQDDLNLSFSNNFSKIDGELGLIKSTDKSFRDDQKKWNKASTDATTSLNNFQDQQTEINDLVQEQMWSQLDMIEQLDIQTPRVMHMKENEGDYVQPPSWVFPYDVYRTENPFVVSWNRGSNARWAAWQAKGKWEGELKHTINFTNGAVDVYVHDITKDGVRSRKERGGAIFVSDYRNSTFEIYPTHLGRTVGIRNTGSGWSVDESVMETGGPSLIRHQTKDVIRFTNSVVCNEGVFITPPPPQGGYNITAGTVISPRKFDRKNFEVGVTYIFTEKPFTTNTW